MKMSKEVKILSSVALIVLVISLGLYFFAKGEKESKLAAAPALPEAMENFSVGPKDAKVTVVEFFDPECESCAQVSPYIKTEMKYYKDKVRWVFRYMAYHPNSRIAIHILEAARKQNLFLEAQTSLFERQHEWGAKHDGSDQSQSKEKEMLAIVANIPGLDMKKLQNDMNDPSIDKLIEKDKVEGTNSGVTGTPTLFVNGKIIDPISLDTMIERIEAGLK